MARMPKHHERAGTRPVTGHPHLVYPQQKRNPERPEHLFVEVRHGDEHLVLFVYVHLVQRYFLGTQEETHRAE